MGAIVLLMTVLLIYFTQRRVRNKCQNETDDRKTDPMGSTQVIARILRPEKGQIGDVQANESMTKNFIFDETMFTCNFYEDSMRCQRQQSYLTSMIETKKNALPMTAAWHYLKVDKDGQLTSELLQSAPLVVSLQFTDYQYTLETRTVCPKFTDADINVVGCFSCERLASLEFEAFSTCAPGIADVHFERLTVHTRSVYLQSERKTLEIRLQTDVQCLEEKLCLRASTVTACKTLNFCMDPPSIHLKHPNLSYAYSHGATADQPWNFEWWPTSWTLSATGTFKLIIAALTSLLLLLFTMSTILTCCRR